MVALGGAITARGPVPVAGARAKGLALSIEGVTGFLDPRGVVGISKEGRAGLFAPTGRIDLYRPSLSVSATLMEATATRLW